jgi:Kdo2-lipid IVA lauroyltransferase/acyltransferase
MNKFKYFFQFIIIISFFFIFKLLGLKYSGYLSGYILRIFGPLLRSNKICYQNVDRVFPKIDEKYKKKLINKMWFNYGRILSEYIFLKDFRIQKKFQKKITIINQYVLDEIKLNKRPVIFISGHFNNFELMAMQIEKSGIDLASIYRPLNNIFLNPVMEKIRKKYICKYQIKKGISGTKELLKYFKKNFSIALMIDQRVSEGIECDFFNKKALTTTIPAQFIKKFNVEVVPVYIERSNANDFNVEFFKPLRFNKNENIATITLELNKILEKMIQKNPDQWIWTHNRWK